MFLNGNWLCLVTWWLVPPSLDAVCWMQGLAAPSELDGGACCKCQQQLRSTTAGAQQHSLCGGAACRHGAGTQSIYNSICNFLTSQLACTFQHASAPPQSARAHDLPALLRRALKMALPPAHAAGQRQQQPRRGGAVSHAARGLQLRGITAERDARHATRPGQRYESAHHHSAIHHVAIHASSTGCTPHPCDLPSG